MSVLRLMPNKPKTPLRAVRVPTPLWERTQARAAERGESVSTVIRRALEEYAK